MPKGYNEFIQYITTLISTSTNMSSIKSPHEGCSKTKTSTFFQISLNCCCLRITTSGSPAIASYWPLKVCKSINHTSLTNSTAFCLIFWNTHLHLAFHNTQTTREDIVDQTISSSKQQTIVVSETSNTFQWVHLH